MRAQLSFHGAVRLVGIILLVGLSLCLLIACGRGGPTYEDGLQQGYQQGWQSGAKAMGEKLIEQARGIRRDMRGPMQGRLLILAVIAALATLFGAKWADAIRQTVGEMFQVPLPTQVSIATGLYLAVVGGLLWYGLAKCGIRDSIPAIILVAGSVIPFLDYCAALLASDAPRRRSAFARAKAMLLLALVVIIILRILSDEGFMRIQIGRVGSFPPFF
jgi:hypothetical protein